MEGKENNKEFNSRAKDEEKHKVFVSRGINNGKKNDDNEGSSSLE